MKPSDSQSMMLCGAATCVRPCIICRRPRKMDFWLNGYHGLGSAINGWTCRQCFESVSHDAYGKPKYPARYRRALNRYRSNWKLEDGR